MRPLTLVPDVVKLLLQKQAAEVSRKLFFVTDKDLIRFHVADKVVEVFEKAGIPYEIYSDVKANPTIANVQNGVAASRLPVLTLSLHWVAVLPLTRLKVSVS